MTFPGLFMFAMALIVTACAPGPSAAALVARVLTSGFRDVLPFLAAMWLGEALWLTCAVAGLTVMAQTFALAFLVLKLLGVVYLLFIAWKMWIAPPAVHAGNLPKRQSSWRTFVAGLAVTLGNPKIMVFYLALLPTIIDLSQVGVLAWFQLTITMIVVLVTIDISWALLAVRARKLLRNPRAVKITNRASASIMTAAAAAIAAR